MRVVTIIFGVLCLGMGAAFAIVFAILTVDNLQYPNPNSYSDPAWWIPGIFAVVFLPGGFLLLRRSPKS